MALLPRWYVRGTQALCCMRADKRLRLVRKVAFGGSRC